MSESFVQNFPVAGIDVFLEIFARAGNDIVLVDGESLCH